MFKPARTCIGCCSLTIGVETISFVTLLSCIWAIATVTSKGDLDVFGHPLSPTIQCAVGTWAFLGILVAITSGTGVLHRLELPLRVFVFYLSVSFVGAIVGPMGFLLSGSLCDKVVSDDVQQLGSSFVCGFTDSFAFFCMLMLGVCNAYAIYMVWSAAEEIALAPFPELIRYKEALRHVHMPDHPQKYLWPMGCDRGAALSPGAMDPGMLMPSFGTAPSGQGATGYGGADSHGMGKP